MAKQLIARYASFLNPGRENAGFYSFDSGKCGDSDAAGD